MGVRNYFPFGSLLIIGILLFSAGCFLRKVIELDPYFGTYFEKMRLIMTDEEIKIYKQLPDEQSKEEFIEEFWRIRDPNPDTEENEFKIAFEERIEYANKWFGHGDTLKGKEEYDGHKRHRGWDTDRGRIYIILGPPDELYFDGAIILGERYTARPEANLKEHWFYNQYRLLVEFTRGKANWWDTHLISVIDSAKLNLVHSEFRDQTDRRLKFEGAFKDNHIYISIPVTRIDFKKSGDKLFSEFKILINVYLDHRKIDTIEETKSVNKTEEQLLEIEEIIFEIPYEPKLEGEYLFDIIVEELTAVLYSKYRNLVQYKLKNNSKG